MAKIYAALIRKGIKTLDEVPARLRSTVKALLAEKRHLRSIREGRRNRRT